MQNEWEQEKTMDEIFNYKMLLWLFFFSFFFLLWNWIRIENCNINMHIMHIMMIIFFWCSTKFFFNFLTQQKSSVRKKHENNVLYSIHRKKWKFFTRNLRVLPFWILLKRKSWFWIYNLMSGSGYLNVNQVIYLLLNDDETIKLNAQWLMELMRNEDAFKNIKKWNLRGLPRSLRHFNFFKQQNVP